jgi:hypothetical protein
VWKFKVSKDTDATHLAQADVRPHRLERYMASDDPDFEAKVADVIGLYLAPPQHAAVFCVDDKTAIQALDRLDPRHLHVGRICRANSCAISVPIRKPRAPSNGNTPMSAGESFHANELAATRH